MKIPAWLSPVLAIGAGPADSDLSQHATGAPPQAATPGPGAELAPPAPRPTPAPSLEALAAELASARAAAGAAAADARQWKAHAAQAAYLADQEHATAQHWTDLAAHRGRLLERTYAELRRFHGQYGRASATIGQLRADLALARETARGVLHQMATTVVHKPWPYCAGDDDPLCACAGPIPADARRTVDAEDLAARLEHVRDTLIQQAHDWDLTAASLAEIANDPAADQTLMGDSATAARSAFVSCAARVRGIADSIPGGRVGPTVNSGPLVAPARVDIVAAGPGDEVDAEVVDADSGAR